MPSRERYLKDKEYYAAYHRRPKVKAMQAAKKIKRQQEGRCKTCGRVRVQGASNEKYCIICLESGIIRRDISRSFF